MTVLGLLLLSCMSLVSAQTPDIILLDHNKARSEQGVAALTYNTTIASASQAYSAQCTWGHSGNSLYGENIAAWSGTGTSADEAKSGLRGWIEGEYPSWNCAANTCSGTCGHYTQVVWQNTKQIGCGLTKCTTGSPFGASFPTWWFYVCNYYPPGNYAGQSPFPASQCKAKTPCSPYATCASLGVSCGNTTTAQDGCGQSCPCSSTATTATTKAPTTTTTATTATTGTTKAPTTTTSSTTGTTKAPTTSTTGSTSSTTKAPTTSTTGTTKAPTTSTTSTTATTKSSTTSTTGAPSKCSTGASYSNSGKTTTVTMNNSGNVPIKYMQIQITGTVTATTGLKAAGTGLYNMTSVPIAAAASATFSYTYSSSTASWTWGSWGC